jgi:hypothetical protein
MMACQTGWTSLVYGIYFLEATSELDCDCECCHNCDEDAWWTTCAVIFFPITLPIYLCMWMCESIKKRRTQNYATAAAAPAVLPPLPSQLPPRAPSMHHRPQMAPSQAQPPTYPVVLHPQSLPVGHHNPNPMLDRYLSSINEASIASVASGGGNTSSSSLPPPPLQPSAPPPSTIGSSTATDLLRPTAPPASTIGGSSVAGGSQKMKKVFGRMPSASSSRLGPGVLQCGICFEPMGSGQEKHIAAGLCGHAFCEECLSTTAATNGRCPNCRQRLSAGDIRRVYV